jgi:uncharacterized protein
MIKILIVIFGWGLLAMAAQAASFDCKLAGNQVEHIICDDPEISKLDSELNARYKAAMRSASNISEGEAGNLAYNQKIWLELRNSCEDAECIEVAYKKINGVRLD